MLDQYLTELVKEEKVQNKLDSHLEELAKTAEAEVELESFMDKASASELAKLAGVELPEGICPQCASEMQKLGSVYQCSCGMTKKASVLRVGAGKGAAFAREMMPGGARMLSGAPQTVEQAGAKLFTGVGGGAPTARELASTGKLRQIGAKLKSMMPSRPAPVMPPLEGKAALAAAGRPIDPGYSEGLQGALRAEGVGGTLGHMGKGMAVGLGGTAAGAGLGALAAKALGRRTGAGALLGGGAAFLPSMLGQAHVQESSMRKSLADKGITRTTTGPWGTPRHTFTPEAAARYLSKESSLEKDAFLGAAARRVGSRIAGSGFGKWVGGTGVGKAVGGKAQQVGQTYSKARGLSGVGTHGPQMQGGKGVGGALWQTAKAHPGVAAGVAGVPLAAGTGYALGKTGSADLTEVGDAAGRIMAKMAVRLAPEEVGEAIEAAKYREDIPGRAASWGRRGAALGGLGGAAAGGGLGRLMGGKGALLAPALGAAAGGVGGGMLGHRIGREEGAEEAAADRLVSMLRGRRAYMAGGQRGYVGGLRRGYAAGRSAGGPGPQ